MTREAIVSILETAGAKASGKTAFNVPESLEMTVLVETPGDVLTVAKVGRVELGEKFLCLDGSRGDRHYFAYESVLGVRTSDLAGNKDRSAGFTR